MFDCFYIRARTFIFLKLKWRNVIKYLRFCTISRPQIKSENLCNYILFYQKINLIYWFFHIHRVIKPQQDPSSLSLLGFGEVFALLFDNHHLYVIDLRTEVTVGRWPLPAYRKSKRGSSFLPGVTSWLNGLDGKNDAGLVFATSMPDHSIHLVLWRENG